MFKNKSLLALIMLLGASALVISSCGKECREKKSRRAHSPSRSKAKSRKAVGRHNRADRDNSMFRNK